MATPTYDLVGETVLTTATSDITFSGLSGYQNYVLFFDTYAASSTTVGLRMNGVTSNSYNWTVGYADSSTLGGAEGGSTSIFLTTRSATSPSSNKAAFEIHFFDVTSSKYKSVVSRSNNGQNAALEFAAGTLRSTDAVTSISLITYSANFSIGAKAFLYGVIA